MHLDQQSFMITATRERDKGMKRNLLQWSAVLMMCLAVFMFLPTSSAAAGLAFPERDEVKRIWNQLQGMYDQLKTYDTEPSVKAPYNVGKVNQVILDQALLVTNFARALAGLPDDVQLDAELNDLAQHGAVLLAANDNLTHYPVKPADMTDAFYNKGYQSTKSSNISSGRDNLSSNVLEGYMPDTGRNADRVGHRRWVLNPSLQKVGFGLANGYGSMQVFDKSRAEKVEYDYIAWPAADFPQQLFGVDHPWSVSVNPDKYEAPSLKDVRVKVTDVQSGKTWTLTSENHDLNSDLYMNVELSGFGVSNAIIFRLDGVQEYKGEYQVVISGLRTVSGQTTELAYTIDFYDLAQHFYPGEVEKWNLQFSTQDAWAYETRTGMDFFSYENRPFIEKGNTLVPLRLISEALGLEVEWEKADRIIRISDHENMIVLKAGSQEVLVNGKKTTVAVAPNIIGGVTFVPLRFVSEQLGLTVDYDKDSKLVQIKREFVH
ncbi:hypothetical protein D3C77_310890 [compost metagenome]